MKSSSGAISIAASARKLEVDDRIALRKYYRIADNLIMQANIYRKENNIIDLYIMLLRFSSLVTETIPNHRDYQSLPREKLLFRKRLLGVLHELETLKPDVQQRLDELNNKSRNQAGRWGQSQENLSDIDTFKGPSVRMQTLTTNEFSQIQKNLCDCIVQTHRGNGFLQGPLIHHGKFSQKPFERKFSLNIPRPKEETLLKHSILGPNGLYGQWQPPPINRAIQYPSNLELTPTEIPSIQQPPQDAILDSKNNGASEREKATLEAVLSLHDNGLLPQIEDSSAVTEAFNKVEISREPFPPPARVQVEDFASHHLDSTAVQRTPLEEQLVPSEAPLQVRISASVMDAFMRLAKSNTDRNLETCGVLAGSLKKRKFYVTALIIPKQESTSDSCQTTNEEEIFDYQDKLSLFPLGWIHTHPTQSCFMSSIDVHTHYSYQIMLPEAIAIVMAPKDSSRKHGIFRLTTPGGLSVIRKCQQRGFHPHQDPPEGGPIYDQCSDVYLDPNVRFDVVDLR